MRPNARRIPRAAPEIDLVVQSALWNGLAEAEATVREAIAAAADLCDALPVECELTVVLTDDAAIQALNRQWRSADRPTNVLSFPAPELPTAGDALRFLGDIVIAYEYLGREAVLEGRPPLAHLAHLTVHGFLHLLGYDHATDDEAELMERLEARILAALGLPDPYAERGHLRAITP
ncbi:MAG TPA: rRNA maturation RNase YbeY [Xanthobacteraceae bacterium]|nr:rRNA maturation RNase YbeY [Xanthobacteraceae bacterium]